jgi:hypothetical protein
MSKRSGRRQARPGYRPAPVLATPALADRHPALADPGPCPVCPDDPGLEEVGPCGSCGTIFGTCSGEWTDDGEPGHPLTSWDARGRRHAGERCPACGPAPGV